MHTSSLCITQPKYSQLVEQSHDTFSFYHHPHSVYCTHCISMKLGTNNRIWETTERRRRKKSTTTYFLVGRGRKNVRLITVLHCTVLSLPLLLLSILPGCNMLCCAPFFWNSICSVCYIHLSLCILLRLIHFQFRFFTLIHRFLVCLSLSRSRSRSLSLLLYLCASHLASFIILIAVNFGMCTLVKMFRLWWLDFNYLLIHYQIFSYKTYEKFRLSAVWIVLNQLKFRIESIV